MRRLLTLPLAALCLALAGCATSPAATVSHWDLAVLDTTEGLQDLTPWERDLVVELNRLRSDPPRYARLYVQPLARRYVGRLLFYPGSRATLTVEGVAAARDCLRELADAPPRPLLRPDAALAAAALDHVEDTGPAGLLGHLGSDGSDPRDRVRRRDPELTGVGEAIHYGPGDPRRIVVSLLLDDGVPGRTHRHGLLDPAYRLVGAATGPHRTYGQVAVLDFAARRRGPRRANARPQGSNP